MTLNRQINPPGGFSLPANGFSMRPEILPGDNLQITPAAPETIKVGDIFVFKKEGRIIAHRVLRNLPGQRRFLEKGDGKFQPYLIDYADVIGKVTAVERAGICRTLGHRSQRIRSRIIAFCSLNKYRLIIILSWIKHRIGSLAFPKFH